MIVSCPSCDSKYQVADEKVAGNVLRTRCKACGSQILVDGALPLPPKNDEEEDGVTRIMRPEDRPDSVLSQPPLSSRGWTVHVGQEQTQSMTSEDIVEAILTGRLRDDTSVWKSGMSQWVTIADIPEIISKVEVERRKSRTASGKNAASNPLPVSTTQQRATASIPRTRTSKPPPPVRASVAPAAPTKAGSPATTASKPSARPPYSPPAPKTPIIQDVKASLDPEAAPEDFYSKILAKVRPQKEGSVPPPANSEPRPIQAQRKTLTPPASAPAPAPAAAPVAALSVDIEIPIETDIPDAPRLTPPPAPQSVSRRTSPAPPIKHQEPENPVNVQLPSIAGVTHNPAASQIVLPGAFPLAVSSRASAPPATPAAATNSVQPTAPSVILSPSSRPPAPELSRSDDNDKRALAVDANKPSPANTDEHTSPRMRAAGQGRSRSLMGTVVVAVVVGLLGVGGGVAATVYTLKGPPKDASSSAAKPITVTQAATPASAKAPVVETAQAKSADVNAGAVQGENLSGSSGSPAPQTDSPKSASKSTKSVSAPATTKSATASPMPAKVGTAPFNRDAALAVLGIAASRAATCKRPGGPSGSGKALVTFDSDGKVVVANIVGDEIAGSAVARCLVSLFQRVKVAPFAGDRQTVSKSFTVPQ